MMEKFIKPENTTNTSYLSFRLNEESFAIPAGRTIEIIEVPTITKMPHTPEFVIGVVNMRSVALPIINTRIKFGMETAEFTVNTCIIVVNIELNTEVIALGILVDEVLEVFEVETDKIQSSPLGGIKSGVDFISGMIKVKEKFMMLVDIDKTFSKKEIELLSEKAELENLSL